MLTLPKLLFSTLSRLCGGKVRLYLELLGRYLKLGAGRTISRPSWMCEISAAHTAEPCTQQVLGEHWVTMRLVVQRASSPISELSWPLRPLLTGAPDDKLLASGLGGLRPLQYKDSRGTAW